MRKFVNWGRVYLKLKRCRHLRKWYSNESKNCLRKAYSDDYIIGANDENSIEAFNALVEV